MSPKKYHPELSHWFYLKLKKVIQLIKLAAMIPFKSFKLLIVMGFLLLTNESNAQQTISLKTCHDSIAHSFPLVNQVDKLARINALKLDNLSTNYLPTLNIKAKATYQSEVVEFSIPVPGVTMPEMPKEQYAATFEISQVIYDGGHTKAAKTLNEQSNKVEQQKVSVDIYQIKEKVNQIYFSGLLVQENIKIMELTRQNINEQKTALQSAVDNGVVLASELDNLNAELLKLEQRLIELETLKMQLYSGLSVLTGIEMPSTTELTLPQVEPAETENLNRPEHHLFNQQKSLMDASIEMTSKNRMPTIGAFATAGYGKPGFDFFNDKMHGYYIVGAQMQWNIWDWKQTQRKKEELHLQKAILDDKEAAFNKNLKVSLSDTELKMQKLERLIEKDNQIIALQQKISERTASQMKNGTKTSVDYLRDLNAVKQAKINLKTREIQKIQTQIEQHTLTGTPLF